MSRRRRQRNRRSREPNLRSDSRIATRNSPHRYEWRAWSTTYSGPVVWLCRAIALATIAVYAPLRHFPFISLDDPQYVSANPMLAHGITSQSVWWALTTGNNFYWHPVTWLSHLLDVQLFGLNAGAHHVTSLLIHVANSILLFGLLNRMTAAPQRSAFVAGLFALHPLHVESVAWIAERKDVLSTFFWMLTVWAYLGYVKDARPSRTLAVMALFALGLTSKPMVVTLPVVLLLLDYWPLGRVADAKQVSAWVPLVREKIPLFGLSALSTLITFLVQRDAGAVVTLQALPLHVRLGNALVSYAAYARDAVWPARLAVFYPFDTPSLAAIVMSAASIAIVATFAWRTPRAYVKIGILWYLVTLLPVIGLVQAGGQGRADRFTYVPLIGLLIIVAWGGSELFKAVGVPPILIRGAAGAALASCAALTGFQVGYWRSNVALWGHAGEVTSNNYRAENHYGVALSDEGRLDEAIQHYTAAIAIWPDYAEAHNNLGTARVDQGRTDDAIREFAEAVRIKPSDPMFRYNLAAVLQSSGRTSEALHEIQMALRLKPGDPTLLGALAVISDTLHR